MKSDEKKKQLQEKYLELQILDSQIKQVEKQLQLLEAQVAEISAINAALDELSLVQPGSELLVPVSSGIFVRAELKDNKEVMVNVGGNTVVVKDIPSTKSMLAKQISDIRGVQDELARQHAALAETAEKLTVEINNLAEGKE